jgi:manganese/zinc/iron transport system substrate-binding protein
MRYLWFIFTAFIAYGLFLAYSHYVLPHSDNQAEGARKPVVVTTTTMVTAMVQDIGGDDIHLISLMGPAVDPHLYKPSANDAAKLSQADLIFYNGLMLEGRMGDLFTQLSNKGLHVYAISQNIPQTLLLSPPDMEGHSDPHIWFDPSLWSTCVDVVVAALSAYAPDKKSAFEARGHKLKDTINEVDFWAKNKIGELSPEKRILVTSHDAYNYFGRAYGFQVVGVQGISTVSEAGLADITSTVDFIKAKGVKAVFIESSVSPATIERISKDARARIGGELFSDAMGLPGEIETGPDGAHYDLGTWEGMMKHNVNTIVEALK